MVDHQARHDWIAILAVGPLEVDLMFMHHAGPYGYFPLGLLSGLATLLFLAGLVLLVVWFVRAMTGPGSMHRALSAPPPAPESPLDILRRRFAAGEISAEDFQKARDLLGENPKQ
jgi:putative membrane protein